MRVTEPSLVAAEEGGGIALCPPVFSFLQWFDALVDGFFVVDFFFRCVLFGNVNAKPQYLNRPNQTYFL